ncbi:Ribosomal RNA-processing protein 14 [Golovinomyces cichoracearum]|uniref:Ribosomal RNA-processing protein 14 n=1 Tax=Golovinomyces cichoracearum TaxID=62708 RepID=A0A420IJ51_9PEZI|nr:Ribosomal RNA-processing protein 14 [Golovinomyces cichoracearum]
MADNSLKDRLLGHAKSFDGLLSLIPAKLYYGEDNSNQWKKKKQTKEQAAAAQKAKLDPDAIKSAKDVMDERARKRKLEEIAEQDGVSDNDCVQKEHPKQGLKLKKQSTGNKQKKLKEKGKTQSTTDISNSSEKLRLKQERQKDKKLKTKNQQNKIDSNVHTSSMKKTMIEEKIISGNPAVSELVIENDGDSKALQTSNTSCKNNDPSPVISKSPTPTFEDLTEPSSNTSTSSVIPPTKVPKNIKVPTDPDLLRSRLAAKIEALRDARKANGPNGFPARNRQELLEARRRKEEQRRAHKKELRRKARAEEEERQKAAVLSAKNSSGSGLETPKANHIDQNLSFSRIAFADGQQMADDLSGLRKMPRKHGPQDAATSLLISEKKRLKIAGLDEEKRLGIEEKDLWLNAKKRVNGEKLRNDPSLLKKTLKRKEKAKKKSEKEWQERNEGIAKGQAMRQKKREENLKQRRDSKGIKGKKPVKSKKTKVKSRPGFEGSFTSGKTK